MYKRKTRNSSIGQIITSTPLENDEGALNTDETFRNITNVVSQKQSNDEGCSKAKKLKNNKTPSLKPFSTKYFQDIVQQNGLKFAEEIKMKHTLTCEPMTFQKNIKSTLENNVDFPRNASEFVNGFKNLTKEDDQLKEFLIQNIVLTVGDEEHQLPDSFLKLLLNVTCLQEMLLDYILERATEFAIEDKASWVQLLLQPFMFLDNVNFGAKLIRGILELMDIAGCAARQEIITSLPNVVTNLPHENIVLELVKYLNEDQSLTPTILDCLSFLHLSDALKEQVHMQMLNTLKSSVSPQFFPNLVSFFFSGNTDIKSEVVSVFREGLDWTMLGSQTNMDISSSQVMTIMALKCAFTKCKNLSNTWMKIINQIKTFEEHKPLDILVLLVIYSTSTTKENTIEGVFRKRIKSSLFKNGILDAVFKKFRPVLKEYLKEMLKVARVLIKTKNEPLVVDFASHWFITIFKELKSSQKTVIRELLIRDYSEKDDTILVSLNILSKLAEENIEMLKPHSLQIFGLKDSLETLTLSGLHHVMDLLAGLAYGVENSFLDGDVQMMINKQLGSSDVDVKIRGIILGVMVVKHLALSESSQNQSTQEDGDTSYTEIISLPDGPAKDAASVVELILKSTSKMPNLTCLFYDELSQVLSAAEFVNSKFISWLSASITNDLTDTYIKDVDENIPTNLMGIPIVVDYCLNVQDEVDEHISLNIAGLCLDDCNDGSELKILPSLMRLTQLIYMKQCDGDLSGIDALLGCGVLIPKIESDDDLENYELEQVTKILDCFVYCINWFRELINAFCTQKHILLRSKVIQRLNGLICLEKKLANMLKGYPLNYKPPICSYENVKAKNKPIIIKEKLKKVTKKKVNPKSKTIVEDNDTSVLPATMKTQAETSHVEDNSHFKCKLNTNFFRVFNLQVLNLFTEALIVNDEPEDALKNPNNNFNIHILSLLLEEINPKLSEMLPSKLKKNTFLSKPVEMNYFHVKPIDVIDELIEIMPRICHYMETIAQDTQSLLEDSNAGRDSLGLLTLKCHSEQLCLTGLFNMLTTMFSWIGFQTSTNLPKLKEGLKIFATRRHPTKKVTYLKDLVTETCLYILQYKDWSILINVAVSLVSLYKTLMKIYEDKNLIKHMMLLSLDTLSVAWNDVLGNAEKGLVFNQHLDFLLSCYFIRPDVNMIMSLSSELKVQVSSLAEKNSVLNTFKSINKSNFPLLYRSSYTALYEATKNEIDKGLTDRQHIELWKDVAMTMNHFIDILKIQESRTNLLTFLKRSMPMLRLFLSQGMPMMELKLKSSPDSVVEVLKTLQHTTRFLHSLHCHSRLKKDTAFMTYLPQLKLILETLVYKVKIALTSNNCSEAFWMGNLKNKNLQGEVILSQSSTSGDDEMEDQLPEDDQSVCSDLDEDATDPGSKTVSKMF